MLSLSACQPMKTGAKLSVNMVFDQQVLDCSASIALNGKSWQLGQAQFYLANIEIQNQQGQWQQLPLKVNANQNSTLALVGQHCAQHKQAYWQLVFEQGITFNNFQAIRFALGVPFSLNHQNPLTQETPLNVSSMFWVWQTGHKFARIELVSEQDNWIFHLGSTGCQSPSVMRAPTNGCRYPNLYTFELPINKDDDTLTFDLAKLINGVQITEQTSCQSERQNLVCQQLLQHLSTGRESGIFRMNHE
ncbi:MbnP family copper-binding protein [Thalassotalea sp. G2M2-11]|uniref:MbnP family copper-binding protein n=1 Tax=Thalassotalea sp. G2M2-11 TaxID=2787627 RepID=UPI0019D0EDF4|nr:MbnP family copper-binding protein [Thalassotalea sp. G2M2-11]